MSCHSPAGLGRWRGSPLQPKGGHLMAPGEGVFWRAVAEQMGFVFCWPASKTFSAEFHTVDWNQGRLGKVGWIGHLGFLCIYSGAGRDWRGIADRIGPARDSPHRLATMTTRSEGIRGGNDEPPKASTRTRQLPPHLAMATVRSYQDQTPNRPERSTMSPQHPVRRSAPRRSLRHDSLSVRQAEPIAGSRAPSDGTRRSGS